MRGGEGRGGEGRVGGDSGVGLVLVPGVEGMGWVRGR